MEIVLCADNGYVPYAAVTLVSALERMANPSRASVTLLTPGIDAERERALVRLGRERGARVRVHAMDLSRFDAARLRRFGIASLLRLYMHDALAADAGRALYLDCDMVVLGDLETLWELPLRGNTLAAARDIAGDPDEHAAISAGAYFNSGLLVVDLARWRSRAISARCQSFLDERLGELRYPDQDALNHALADDWLELEPAWNVQSSIYGALDERPAHLASLQPALAEALRHPRVIHYTGDVKPWHASSQHPLRDVFLHYSGRTPWPITAAALAGTLSLRQRVRMALKARKIRRRRRLTDWQPPAS